MVLFPRFGDEIKPRFCGMHLRSRPSHGQLVKLISTATILSGALDSVESLLASLRGKGSNCASTPNCVVTSIGMGAIWQYEGL